MLKPLPQEGHEAQPSVKTTKNVTPAKIKEKTRANFLRLEVTLPKKEKRKTSFFTLVIAQITNFIKKAENISLQELTELIHNLQRTALYLEKKRIQLIRSNRHKKKR